jgi:hypothetical protein
MALKVMSSRFLLAWELYNFDIRGSAGILLVLDGRETIVALVIKRSCLVFFEAHLKEFFSMISIKRSA